MKHVTSPESDTAIRLINTLGKAIERLQAANALKGLKASTTDWGMLNAIQKVATQHAPHAQAPTTHSVDRLGLFAQPSGTTQPLEKPMPQSRLSRPAD